jgi:hypothetical protein
MNSTSATTNSACRTEPIVNVPARPSIHATSRMTAMVYSMVYPLNCDTPTTSVEGTAEAIVTCGGRNPGGSHARIV